MPEMRMSKPLLTTMTWMNLRNITLNEESQTQKRMHCMTPFITLLVFCCCFFIPTAYGGSQARGLIRAATAGLCQSHSNARSELRLRPTPQLMATPDP